MDRKTREELNALSKKVFGSTSKWQKLVNNGVAEPFERDREVMVTTANGQLVKKVFTDRKYVNKRYSVEEVRKLMESLVTPTNPTVDVSSLTPNQALDLMVEESEKLGLYDT